MHGISVGWLVGHAGNSYNSLCRNKVGHNKITAICLTISAINKQVTVRLQQKKKKGYDRGK